MDGNSKRVRALRTIAVIGGAGFVGSNFVRKILAGGGWRVIVFDKLTHAGCLANLRDVETDPWYRFVLGDLADAKSVRMLIDHYQPDAIANFAGESRLERPDGSPRDLLRSNVDGTFELFEAARHYWNRLGADDRANFRMLQVSTHEVFGAAASGAAQREDDPFAPESLYTATKACSNLLASAYYRTYELPVTVANCSSSYGPFQSPDGLIPGTVLTAIAARDEVAHAGRIMRDWIFVEDSCDALMTVLERGCLGETYNIGGNSDRTNDEVVAEVIAAVEERKPAARNPAMRARGLEDYSQLRARQPDIDSSGRRYSIDCGRIERELGWTPRTSFRDGIRSTVKWYLGNLDWCAEVQNGQDPQRRCG